MTQQEIIDALKVLADIVSANKGFLGSESTMNLANNKIKELIPLLKTN